MEKISRLKEIERAHEKYIRLVKPFQLEVTRLCRKNYLESLGIVPLSLTEKKKPIREKVSKCELCHSTKSLEVHHRPLNRVFYSPTEYAKWHNNPKNLIVVCRLCHSKLDQCRARFIGNSKNEAS